MIRPVVGRLAEIAYSQMEPVARAYDEARGWPLLKFLHAYYLPLQQVDDIVRDRDDFPGWGILFDPEQCPARYLPWLAMFAGVRLRVGMTEAQMRALIKDRPALARCTPQALVDQVKTALLEGSTKKVILRERYKATDPGVDHAAWFEVITKTDETPDPDAVRRAILEQKEVGLLFTYIVQDGQDWQELIDTHGTWQDVIDDYATWDETIADS